MNEKAVFLSIMMEDDDNKIHVHTYGRTNTRASHFETLNFSNYY